MSKILASVSLWLVALPLIAQGDSARMMSGDVFVGVDTLGRVLVAVDQAPSDGWVENYFLFTARDRLSGPWSRRLSRANVVYKSSGTLVIQAMPPDLVVSLTVADAPKPKMETLRSAEVFEVADGRELAVMEAEQFGRRQLDTMSHGDLETWPEAFGFDLLNSDSDGPCPADGDCMAGGIGASECSVSCGFGTGCSVTCGDCMYACCKCAFVSCRCRLCMESP